MGEVFTKITKELFYGFNSNKEDGIYKHIKDDKTLLILDYLYINRNLLNVSLFSLEDMIIKSGFVPRAGYDKSTGDLYINEKFKAILLLLHNLKVIELNNLDIKPKQFNYCSILTNLDNNFFMLDEDIKRKIMSYNPNKEKNKEGVDNYKLLIFYCYVLSRMYRRPDGERDIRLKGGKAEVCYASYDLIYNDIGLSDDTINKYNAILEEMDLIRVRNAGQYRYKNDRNKKIHESANTYALYDTEGKWEDEINEALKAYKNNENLEFVKRITTTRMKSINGSISQINYLERIDKATEKQIKERDDLLIEKELGS